MSHSRKPCCCPSPSTRPEAFQLRTVQPHRFPKGLGGTIWDASGTAGSLLVLSVWALATFSILGVGVARITSAQISVARRVEQQVVSQALAEAAVRHAMALRKHDRTAHDTQQELGTKQERELGRGSFTYTMTDESSRLSLNTASQEMLARVPGLDLDAAIEITTSTLRPFPLLEVLLGLDEAVSPEMLEQARPFLTVYGNGKVNVNTASPEVLKALGLEAGMVDTIVAFREGQDEEWGTADDGVFEEAGAILSTLRERTSFLLSQETKLIELVSQGILDVRSAVAAVDIETRVLTRPVSSYTMIIDPAQQKILRWSEGGPKHDGTDEE